MLKQIPNLLTISNLVLGCLAIITIINGNTVLAAQFILIAAVLDFCDGFAARALHAYSDIGKQLDSLADLVSFGVAPAMILYQILNVPELTNIHSYLPYLSILLPVAAAWRLAKFNLDDSQSKIFIGLPSPAAGILAASFGLTHPEVWFQDIFNPIILLPLVILLSALMVSPFRMFSMKFQNTGWSDNWIRYVFLAMCVFLISPIGINYTLVSLILLLYIILAFGYSLLPTKN